MAGTREWAVSTQQLRERLDATGALQSTPPPRAAEPGVVR
jgi:hypothetical protein